MALDKLTLLDETIINNTATSVATTVVNNSAQTNYISFPVATASPTSNGWRVYKDTDTVAPTVGTGGSPNTTLTQNTDTPLNSTGDFRLTKTSSASRRGEGISTDFTIASRHLAKVLQISFDYELISGTLATDDIRVYIIQDPTGTPVVIEPVNVSIQGSLVSSPTIKLRHLATFQTHISVTSYRLCIHVASTSTSAYTVDFNNFRVWEPSQSIGSIITDPTLYTPTLTNIPLSSSSLYFHREGAYGFIQGTITLSGGGNTGEARVGLPSGWVISSIITSIREVGKSISSSTGFSSPGWQGVILAEGGTNYLTFGRDTATTSGLAKLQGNDSSFASLIYTINAKVPIAGWGSSVAMSSDSGDGRVVAARYTNTSISSNVFIYSTRIYDTHNAYSNGVFTAPISGYYRFSLTNRLAVGCQIYMQINETNVELLGDGFSNSGLASVYSSQIYLLAGQRLRFFETGGNGLSFPNTTHAFSIERISAGSQIMAQNETVSASYYSAATQTSLTAQINFGTRVYDTHGAVTTGVGAWRFTAPMSGKYLVTYSLGASTTSSQYVEVWKNGLLERRNINGGATHGSSSFQLNLLSSEYFDLRPNSSMTVSGSSSNDGNRSFIEITRIGN